MAQHELDGITRVAMGQIESPGGSDNDVACESILTTSPGSDVPLRTILTVTSLTVSTAAVSESETQLWPKSHG